MAYSAMASGRRLIMACMRSVILGGVEGIGMAYNGKASTGHARGENEAYNDNQVPTGRGNR